MALAGEPAAAAPAAAEAEPDDEAGAAAGVVDEAVELHAAAPTAMLAAMPDTASTRRFFMASP
jgi:stage V sporulation protein SpoVS